jgi:acetyl esterase/lipase
VNEASLQAFLAGLSPEARTVLEPALSHVVPPPPAADDLAGWRRLQSDIEERSRPACEQALGEFAATVEERKYAGLPALWIRPAESLIERPALFLHGGGYTGFSARSSLFASLPLAAGLSRPLLAFDYPLAPASTCDATVPATAAALAAALSEYPGAPLVGDSAGGGLALATTLRLLREGQGAPSSLVLISPWTDLGERGDSRLTLRDHDPILAWDPHLAACAASYAPGVADHPDASPVMADYGADFPPTLVLCGSREILLSDAVRLYRKLADAGVRARLDIYEGLHHSFPVITPRAPEARRARAAICRFLAEIPTADEPGHDARR